jgi:hypothetical protein
VFRRIGEGGTPADGIIAHVGRPSSSVSISLVRFVRFDREVQAAWRVASDSGSQVLVWLLVVASVIVLLALIVFGHPVVPAP